MLAVMFLALARTGAQEIPPELQHAKAQHHKEAEFTLRPLRERYIARLETLKRTMTGRGDVRAAVAVQDEIDLLVATVNEAAILAKFVGFWVGPAGANRRYSIKADGTVQWVHENTTILATGRLVRNGKDFTFIWDANGDEVSRVNLTDTGIVMDIFQPRTTYPAQPPANRIILTRTAVSR